MLDEIGRRLFESQGLRTEEIDKIVSNQHLFVKITDKIAARSGSPAVTVPRVSLMRNTLAIAGFAVIAVVGVNIFRFESAADAVRSGRIPDAVPDVARPEVPPRPFVGKLSAGRAIKTAFRPAKAAVDRNSNRNRRSVERHNELQSENEFYPVGYTGDPVETSGGGRILRVAMNRSSLFALGVNLPLENEDETIKADLLVGSDGVTRAVRVVK